MGTKSPTTGVFAFRLSYGINSITDGTSNTIAFSEGLCGPGVSAPNRPGPGALVHGAGLSAAGFLLDPYADAGTQTSLPGTNVLANLQTCSTKNVAANLSGGHGHYWCIGATNGAIFNTIVPPNSTQFPWAGCKSDGSPGQDGGSGDFSNAQSNHPGGVNTLLADGSVKFIKSTVNIRTWWGLGTRAGGEVISADSY